MFRDHFRLLIAGRKSDEHARNQSDERAGFQKQRRLLRMFAAQGVKRADGGDDKGAGDERGALIVQKHNHRPRV